MLKAILVNPFMIVGFSFLVSYLLYTFPFSNKYYELDFTSILPGLYFILLNFFGGIIWSKLNLFYSKGRGAQYKSTAKIKINILGAIVVLLILIEFFIYGIPLLGHVAYTDFGAPIIHVALVSSMLVLSILSCFNYSTSSKWMYISLFISILILNRFLILFIFISSIIVYLCSANIRFKKLFVVILGVIFFIYLFGVLGTWRMSNIMDVPYKQAQDYILTAGNASDYYKDTGLPVSVFWFWVYVTSPLSNFVLNIKFNEVGDLYNIINVISFELFPQTISKHLGEYPIEVMLLSENLNVSTAVTPVYVALGYLGITIYFLYYSSVFFFSNPYA